MEKNELGLQTGGMPPHRPPQASEDVMMFGGNPLMLEMDRVCPALTRSLRVVRHGVLRIKGSA